jgi:membrane protease YdiL (CAAX protease family)
VKLALISLLLIVVAVLMARASRRDRRDYRKFKKLTSTRKRQKTFARWLREAFAVFGGMALLVLLAAWQFVPRVLQDALTWPPLTWAADALRGGAGTGFAAGASIAVVVGLVLPVILLRKQLDEIPMIGDIGALLPRTRGELIYGAGLAINAGLVEELLFRLAIPALLFGITGNGIVSFALASLLFGMLHLYQGIAGVLGATLLGIVFSLVYLLSGSIVVVMVLHALIDLRALVLIPVVVRGVHHVTGDAPHQKKDSDAPTLSPPL